MTGFPLRSAEPSPAPVRRRLAATLAAVALVAAACGGGDTAEPAATTTAAGSSGAETTSSGIPQLDFSATELAGAGGLVDGGDFEGTDLVVWFWAPW